MACQFFDPPLFCPDSPDMPSPYATAENSQSLWIEQSSYVSTHIAAIAYGLHATLFATILHFVFHPKQMQKRGGRWVGWFAMSCALFAIGTISLACSIHFNQTAWVDERNYPGGPLAFLTEQQGRSVLTVGNSATLMASCLAGGLLLHRVFILWNNRWQIVVLPALFYLASITLGVLRVAQIPMKNLGGMIDLGVVTWSCLVALNMCLSMMIAVRIIMMRRTVINLLGRDHARVYTGAAAFVIEAAMPFMIISTVLLVLFGGKSTSSNLFVPLLVQIECISPLLIILRIFRNQAWSSFTLQNHPNQSYDAAKAHVPLQPIQFTSIGSSRTQISEYSQSKNQDLESKLPL
ncbi:hypothetical protein BD779DRAFT_177394 [Infundibulicybe gibba]|nr:hypothetical protein BD779DRAFT_177394 [Infundibulicybe gibba]